MMKKLYLVIILILSFISETAFSKKAGGAPNWFTHPEKGEYVGMSIPFGDSEVEEKSAEFSAIFSFLIGQKRVIHKKEIIDDIIINERGFDVYSQNNLIIGHQKVIQRSTGIGGTSYSETMTTLLLYLDYNIVRKKKNKDGTCYVSIKPFFNEKNDSIEVQYYNTHFSEDSESKREWNFQLKIKNCCFEITDIGIDSIRAWCYNDEKSRINVFWGKLKNPSSSYSGKKLVNNFFGNKGGFIYACIPISNSIGLGYLLNTLHMFKLYCDNPTDIVWGYDNVDNGVNQGLVTCYYHPKDNRFIDKQIEQDNLIAKEMPQNGKNPSNSLINNINPALKRIALVIGNGDYSTGRLTHTRNDAKDISKKLGELGFETILRTNQNIRNMKTEISSFCHKAQKYDAALFYYAGHAMQDKGINYLMPIGASISRSSDIEFECVNLNWILKSLEDAEINTKIIILDACRDNPIARSWELGSISPGLTQTSVPKGTILEFSTQPGEAAMDGDDEDRNSPYAGALLQVLDRHMLPIHDVFLEVRKKVAQKTDYKQNTYQINNLLGDFYFNMNRE